MKRRFLVILVLLLSTLACSTITGLVNPAATIILKPVDPANANTAALAQAQQVIQKRLDLAGIKSNVSVQGSNQISVAIYSAKDLDAAQKLSTAIGALAFVDSKTAYPDGYQFGTKFDAVLTQADIQAAVAQKDGVGGYEIAVLFSTAGTKKMADYSRANIGHYLLIVKDGVILSSPILNGAITDGNAVIAGQFSQSEAEIVAAQLGAQVLPFELQVDQIKQ